MSSLLKLKSNPGARKRAKEVGRGNGSGHGTYSTRGMNGQSQRTGSQRRPGFEGGQTPLYRKMPKLKGFNNPNNVTYQVINVDKLNVFAENEEVDVVKLYEKHLISHKDQPVKLLGDGELTKKLVVKVDKFSALAKEKIEKAGGKTIGLIKSQS
jgi:large subunit ribosomal protein L15